MDDAQRLNDMSGVLSQAWKVGSQDPELQVDFGDPTDIPLCAPFDVDDLIGASKSFKVRTVRADGWHPRHFALVCRDGQLCLNHILYIAEALGDLPPSYRDLHMPTIGDSKRRVIGCFRSLFRLWSRIRRTTVRKWSDKNLNDEFFNNQSGRRIGDATWRASVTARANTMNGDKTIEVLADLKKCFEYVNLAKLWRKARWLGYPLSILRFSISSYRWKRVISWDGMASQWLLAICGLVAGSGFATDELKVYMVEDLRIIRSLDLKVPFLVHVDDFLISKAGPNIRHILTCLMKFLAHLFHFMQNELELVFAPDKTFVLSNTKGLAELVIKNMGAFGGTRVGTVKRLGISFSAGGKMGSLEQRMRIKAALDRKPRTDMLAKAVDSMPGASRIFYGGTMPAATFGAETVGMPKAPIRALGAAAASSLKMPRRMTHSPIAWAILAKGSTRNPEATVLAMPLLRYAREWWLATDPAYRTHDTLTLPSLVNAFEKEKEWLDVKQ